MVDYEKTLDNCQAPCFAILVFAKKLQTKIENVEKYSASERKRGAK